MVVTFLMMLAVALLAVIFRAEFEAWMPWIAERLRRAAVRPLRGALRDRLDEEWASHLAETPGYVGKVVAAMGFNWASQKISIRSALYLFGYRWTVGAAHAFRKLGKAMMAFAEWSDGIPGPRSIRANIGHWSSMFAFSIMFSAIYIMHARTNFIEDEDERARAENSQAQNFEVLVRKLTALIEEPSANVAVSLEE